MIDVLAQEFPEFQFLIRTLENSFGNGGHHSRVLAVDDDVQRAILHDARVETPGKFRIDLGGFHRNAFVRKTQLELIS